ncbi:MAG: phosphatase PAP2 family protein [Phycicoccus sp.]
MTDRPPVSEPVPGTEQIGTRGLAEWRTPVGRVLVRAVLGVVALLGRGRRWGAGQPALVVTVAVGVLVVLGLDLAIAGLYESVIEQDGLAVLDRPLLDAVARLRTPVWDAAITGYTDLGGTVGMSAVVTSGAVALSAWWRSWMPLVVTAVAAVGSALLTVTGKQLVGRVRPPLELAVPPFETSPAFPLGHALNATALIGVLAYLVVLRLRGPYGRLGVAGLAVLWAVAMGLSRVYLGHHWFTDVVCGWLVGLSWLTVVVTGHRVQVTARRRRRLHSVAGVGAAAGRCEGRTPTTDARVGRPPQSRLRPPPRSTSSSDRSDPIGTSVRRAATDERASLRLRPARAGSGRRRE